MNLMLAKILSVAGTVVWLAWPTNVMGAQDRNSMERASTTQNVSLKIGEPFLRARSKIIKLGWKPIPMHQEDDYEYSGTDRILAERNIVEVDACSTDRGVLCIFYYQKLGKCLRVDTIGEKVAQITVTRWTEECPEKN